MERMIRGIVITMSLIVSLIIVYAVFAEPIQYLVDTFIGVDAETGEDIEDTMNIIPFAFGAAIVVGIFCSLILLAAYGHKKEYEQ